MDVRVQVVLVPKLRYTEITGWRQFSKEPPQFDTAALHSVHTPASYTQTAHESIRAARERSIEPNMLRGVSCLSGGRGCIWHARCCSTSKRRSIEKRCAGDIRPKSSKISPDGRRGSTHHQEATELRGVFALCDPTAARPYVGRAHIGTRGRCPRSSRHSS